MLALLYSALYHARLDVAVVLSLTRKVGMPTANIIFNVAVALLSINIASVSIVLVLMIHPDVVYD